MALIRGTEAPFSTSSGLKPSQRRVIYAMSKLNLGPRSKRVKSASGDTSVSRNERKSRATSDRSFPIWSNWAKWVAPIARARNPSRPTSGEKSEIGFFIRKVKLIV